MSDRADKATFTIDWIKGAKTPRFIRTSPPALPLADRQIAITFDPDRNGLLICSQEFQGDLDEGVGYYRNVACVRPQSPSDLFKIAQQLLDESDKEHQRLMAAFEEFDSDRKKELSRLIGPSR